MSLSWELSAPSHRRYKPKVRKLGSIVIQTSITKEKEMESIAIRISVYMKV